MAAPSGIGATNGEGDIAFLHRLIFTAIQNGTIINPTSYIYTSFPRTYTEYQWNSSVEDFDCFEHPLNDIIVTP